MKEQDKTPEKELNKIKTGNLPDMEFKTLVINNECGGRIEELKQRHRNEKKKKEPVKTKNTITEMKTALEVINIRLQEAEDSISNQEDKVEENIQSEQQKE